MLQARVENSPQGHTVIRTQQPYTGSSTEHLNQDSCLRGMLTLPHLSRSAPPRHRLGAEGPSHALGGAEGQPHLAEEELRLREATF